jgi:pyruvate carboxylase subunit B
VKYSVIVGGTEYSIEAGGDEVILDGGSIAADLHSARGGNATVLRLGSAVYRVAFEEQNGSGRSSRRGRYTIWVNGERFSVDALDQRRRAAEQATAAVHRRSTPALKAPMPGLIVKVRVSSGDVVTAGQGLIVMEAMKMENELRAPSAGTVTKVHVEAGKAVEKGALLIEME